MSDFKEIKEWNYGDPPKLLHSHIMVVDYNDDHEFGMYSECTGWMAHLGGKWLHDSIKDEDVKGWIPLPKTHN